MSAHTLFPALEPFSQIATVRRSVAPCPTQLLGGVLCSQPPNQGCFDFETTSSHSIVIEASDGTFTDQFTLTVQLTDVNECSPIVANSSLSCSINENAGAGQVCLFAKAPQILY